MNINNIKNLFRQYFIENWRTDLFQFGILAAVVFFAAIMSASSNLSFPLFVSCIFLMIYPERLFRNLHSNSPKIHFLSIPASNSEKVVTNMLLANFYYVVGLVLASALGLALAHLYLLVRGAEGISLYSFMGAEKVFSIYAMLSVFFFGSIYFRRRTTLSTFGVCLLIGIVWSMLVGLTMWLNSLVFLPETSGYTYNWNFGHTDIESRLAESVPYLFSIGVMIYCYALSFLRLRETEA